MVEMIAWIRRHRILVAVLGTGLAVLIAAGIFVAVHLSSQGNVSNPDVAFTVPTPTKTVPEAKGPSALFDWPFYGYDASRTKDLELDKPMRPPFRKIWTLGGGVLFEFPPVLGGRLLFALKNNAGLYAVSRITGGFHWKKDLGHLAASSPAYANGVVYATILQRAANVDAGRVVALDAVTGRKLWSRDLPSRSESSPVVDHGRVYFGSENGTVYSLRVKDGSVDWTYHASGAVKAGLALSGGDLYFGDYAGKVYAIRARDGHQVWKKSTSGTAFGFSSGTFYSTPAVAFGRVYLGNTDGNMYSYSAKDGSLAWRTGTGSYVYASPAATRTALGATLVYGGSYDGTFYAWDARNGKVRWKHKAEGRISGGAVVLGDLVFYSTLNHHTTALTVDHGRKVWTVNRGAYNPVVSDTCRIYISSTASLLAYKTRAHCPGDPDPKKVAAAKKAAAAKAKARAAKARARAKAKKAKKTKAKEKAKQRH
jgi:outer membrane protein assembly factor BamB